MHKEDGTLYLPENVSVISHKNNNCTSCENETITNSKLYKNVVLKWQ